MRRRPATRSSTIRVDPVGNFEIVVSNAPRVAAFLAGPVRLANSLRNNQDVLVTVYDGESWMPLLRYAMGNAYEALRLADSLLATIENGRPLPVQRLRHRILP